MESLYDENNINLAQIIHKHAHWEKYPGVRHNLIASKKSY
jgi:hypothetical protein